MACYNYIDIGIWSNWRWPSSINHVVTRKQATDLHFHRVNSWSCSEQMWPVGNSACKINKLTHDKRTSKSNHSFHILQTNRAILSFFAWQQNSYNFVLYSVLCLLYISTKTGLTGKQLTQQNCTWYFLHNFGSSELVLKSSHYHLSLQQDQERGVMKEGRRGIVRMEVAALFVMHVCK